MKPAMRRSLARLCAGLGLAMPVPLLAEGWGEVTAPVAGPARSIGQPGAGCLAGAQALPSEGPGYQAVELQRNRYYGHPTLIDYLQALGERLSHAGIGPVLIGDLAQPRGGPMSYGHVSHQTGLDVDIWFRLDVPSLPADQRTGLAQPVLVDAEGRLDPRWSAAHARLVRLAADDPRVARVFVDAAIKRDLCAREWDDRTWLRRIRPWPAHDEHLHVRLRCPPGDEACIDQPEPPPGEGCDAIAATPRAVVAAEPSPAPPLPAACQSVLEQPHG